MNTKKTNTWRLITRGEKDKELCSGNVLEGAEMFHRIRNSGFHSWLLIFHKQKSNTQGEKVNQRKSTKTSFSDLRQAKIRNAVYLQTFQYARLDVYTFNVLNFTLNFTLNFYTFLVSTLRHFNGYGCLHCQNDSGECMKRVVLQLGYG